MSKETRESIFTDAEREEAEAQIEDYLRSALADLIPRVPTGRILDLVPEVVDLVERVVAESDSDNLREVTAVNTITVNVKRRGK